MASAMSRGLHCSMASKRTCEIARWRAGSRTPPSAGVFIGPAEDRYYSLNRPRLSM